MAWTAFCVRKITFSCSFPKCIWRAPYSYENVALLRKGRDPSHSLWVGRCKIQPSIYEWEPSTSDTSCQCRMFRFMVAFTASFIKDTSCQSRMFRFMTASLHTLCWIKWVQGICKMCVEIRLLTHPRPLILRRTPPKGCTCPHLQEFDTNSIYFQPNIRFNVCSFTAGMHCWVSRDEPLMNFLGWESSTQCAASSGQKLWWTTVPHSTKVICLLTRHMNWVW